MMLRFVVHCLVFEFSFRQRQEFDVNFSYFLRNFRKKFRKTQIFLELATFFEKLRRIFQLFGLFSENRKIFSVMLTCFCLCSCEREFFEVFFRKFFEKYEISHQTVVFVETTTQIPKSGDKH
jgi:hypothetical protein